MFIYVINIHKYVIIVFSVLVNIYIYNTNKSVYLYIATIIKLNMITHRNSM